MSAVLKDATPARWRGTTAVNPKTGAEIGVSFDTPNGVVRLELPVESARQLAASLAEYLDPPIEPGVKVTVSRQYWIGGRSMLHSASAQWPDDPCSPVAQEPQINEVARALLLSITEADRPAESSARTRSAGSSS